MLIVIANMTEISTFGKDQKTYHFKYSQEEYIDSPNGSSKLLFFVYSAYEDYDDYFDFKHFTKYFTICNTIKIKTLF